MANYRDDRDALRDKADVLAGELEGTKAALDRAEAENDAKDAEIARLRKLAGHGARARKPPLQSPLVWVLVVGGMAVAGAFAFFAISRAPAPMAPAPGPKVDTKATAATPAEETDVRFRAKVATVKGRSDVVVGDACTIDVRSVVSAGGTHPLVELVVSCAGSELYRLSNRAGTIMSMSSWSLTEASGGYALEYEDLGQRSSDARAQTALSSAKKAGRIFSEGALPAEVTLEMEPVGKKR